MRFSKAWIVAKKDFSVFKKIKYVLYSLVAMPAVVGVMFPVIFIFAMTSTQAQPGITPTLLFEAAIAFVNIFSAYLVLVPAVLPSIIASYSFVGEKVEKSLEPLLATPTTDGELLLGKSLAALLPCLGVAYIGEVLFVGIIDGWSYINLGVFLLPNLYWTVITFVMIPLACLLSVEANVIISSRVNDIRAAQQLGGFVVLPLILLIVFSVINTGIPNTLLGTIVSGGLGAADLGLFFMAKATFKREEILTKWK